MLSVLKGFVDELEVLTDQLGMNKNKQAGKTTGMVSKSVVPAVVSAAKAGQER